VRTEDQLQHVARVHTDENDIRKTTTFVLCLVRFTWLRGAGPLRMWRTWVPINQ